ncbi:integrase core domain-containing protein [Roseovarius sp. SYSU LYC5161]|uniref:integrase core domain-containing protein n=1 Tax=Roseovarius halophilus (ex Wu et al. 2025) TaxID=3376060 RepID=UPI00399B1B1C
MARGKEFTDRLSGPRKRAARGEHAFDRLRVDLGIEHCLTPPKSPRINGMVERFNGRIEEVLQSHHFRSGEELDSTLHRYAFGHSFGPMAVMPSSLQPAAPAIGPGQQDALADDEDRQKLKPGRFRRRPYYLPGCDS